jgi:hypothetical protein
MTTSEAQIKPRDGDPVVVPSKPPREPVVGANDEPVSDEVTLDAAAEGASDEDAPDAKKLIADLESAIGCPVIVYYAQDAAIARRDIDALYRVLEPVGHQARLALVLQSSGGDPDIAHVMATLIREYTTLLDVYVPTYAASAATSLAFNADTLWMGPISELSPIDPQVPVDPRLLLPSAHEAKDESEPVHVPAGVIRDFLELTGVISVPGTTRRFHVDVKKLESVFKPLNPWVLGWYERATKVSRVYAQEALTEHLLAASGEAEERAEKIIDYFIEHYSSHGASIGRSEARKIGLPVLDCPPDVWAALERVTDFYDTVFAQQPIARIVESTQDFQVAFRAGHSPCPTCNVLIPRHREYQYCFNCGTALRTNCQSCNKVISGEWIFCPFCSTQASET